MDRRAQQLLREFHAGNISVIPALVNAFKQQDRLADLEPLFRDIPFETIWSYVENGISMEELSVLYGYEDYNEYRRRFHRNSQWRSVNNISFYSQNKDATFEAWQEEQSLLENDLKSRRFLFLQFEGDRRSVHAPAATSNRFVNLFSRTSFPPAFYEEFNRYGDFFSWGLNRHNVRVQALLHNRIQLVTARVVPEKRNVYVLSASEDFNRSSRLDLDTYRLGDIHWLADLSLVYRADVPSLVQVIEFGEPERGIIAENTILDRLTGEKRRNLIMADYVLSHPQLRQYLYQYLVTQVVERYPVDPFEYEIFSEFSEEELFEWSVSGLDEEEAIRAHFNDKLFSWAIQGLQEMRRLRG